MQVADVDDDDAHADLQGDAGHNEGEHEVIEAVALSPDVQQELELRNLRHRQYRHQRALRLRLRLL